ncbi:methyltransferase domain-containing protein [soil metagenome]
MKKQISNNIDKDIFGMALKAWYIEKDPTDIVVHSPDFDDDIIAVPYLFRDYKDMPLLEKKALENCSGRVLDVGCGAGSHSLYLQNKKNLQVTGIDISPGAIEVASSRGLQDVRKINFFDLQDEKFDTLLFIMNGTGVIGKLDNLDNFFEHSRKLLHPDGKIIIDSSDLRYLFDQDKDGGIWIEMDAQYYGELEFSISYKRETSSPFNWLYLDQNIFNIAAQKSKFNFTLLKEGKHFDYLAELKPV